MTDWRDDRLGIQIEHALAGVTLTPGCDLGVLIRRGNVTLIGQLTRPRDFEAVLDVLLDIPGVEEVAIDVGIAEFQPIDHRVGLEGPRRRWDIRFGDG